MARGTSARRGFLVAWNLRARNDLLSGAATCPLAASRSSSPVNQRHGNFLRDNLTYSPGLLGFCCLFNRATRDSASCNFAALSTRTTPDFLWSCPVKLLSSGNPLFLFVRRSRFSIYEGSHCFLFLLLFFFVSFRFLYFFVCSVFILSRPSRVESVESRRRDSQYSILARIFLFVAESIGHLIFEQLYQIVR